jgi:hypothetical protein
VLGGLGSCHGVEWQTSAASAKATLTSNPRRSASKAIVRLKLQTGRRSLTCEKVSRRVRGSSLAGRVASAAAVHSLVSRLRLQAVLGRLTSGPRRNVGVATLGRRQLGRLSFLSLRIVEGMKSFSDVMKGANVSDDRHARQSIACRTIRDVRGHDTHEEWVVLVQSERRPTADTIDGNSVDQVHRVLFKIGANPAGEEAESGSRDRRETQPPDFHPRFGELSLRNEWIRILWKLKLGLFEDERGNILPCVNRDCSLGGLQKDRLP